MKHEVVDTCSTISITHRATVLVGIDHRNSDNLIYFIYGHQFSLTLGNGITVWTLCCTGSMSLDLFQILEYAVAVNFRLNNKLFFVPVKFKLLAIEDAVLYSTLSPIDVLTSRNRRQIEMNEEKRVVVCEIPSWISK